MTIEEIKELLQPYVYGSDEFEINKEIFDRDRGRSAYNEIIRNSVKGNHGVYLWENSLNGDIVYIGMAGKLKSDGSIGHHSISKRLTASRGKDGNKKDILTNDYIHYFMKNNKINALNFYVFYSKADEPPAYLESFLLYKFLKRNKRLPKLNTSF